MSGEVANVALATVNVRTGPPSVSCTPTADEVPAALFAAVAQVLAYVYQLRASLAGQGAAPGALPVLDVPLELDPHHGRDAKDTE